MLPLLKYPRTQHIQGSRLQPGDDDLEAVPFQALAGRNLIVEEKMDGANSGISFDDAGTMFLQSRGHYLTGGPREKHFHLFKQWAAAHTLWLWERLGSRYVIFGEWLYAKHTIYYNALPHYFLEFDVFDRDTEQFLDTPSRHALLANGPLVSVRVMSSGPLRRASELTAQVGPSACIQGDHREDLRAQAESRGLDADRILRETDPSSQMEGLYLKIEEEGQVRERYKFVRASFLTTVVQSESHWLNRPIVPNQLRAEVDLFAVTTE